MSVFRIAPLALTLAIGLAGCGGNPFLDESLIDENDPNTSVNNKFLWDPENDLTMNSVEHDETDDTLVINNLPFDGPEGRYDNVFTLVSGMGVYESRQTATTGRVKHYAVFLQDGALQGTAAAGVNWVNYGNAGANIRRDSFRLPAGGEYSYIGTYAGVRSFDYRSGIELTTGSASLLLDVLDFDPVTDDETVLQGDIVGNITNRRRVNLDGSLGRELPSIFLLEVSFDQATGTWEAEDGALTAKTDGTEWSSGRHGGMIGSSTGTQLGGYVELEGVADIQRVTYEVVTYSLDGGTYQSSIFSDEWLEEQQELIDDGAELDSFFPAPSLPPGAVFVSSTNVFQTFETQGNARELGVYIANQVTP